MHILPTYHNLIPSNANRIHTAVSNASQARNPLSRTAYATYALALSLLNTPVYFLQGLCCNCEALKNSGKSLTFAAATIAKIFMSFCQKHTFTDPLNRPVERKKEEENGAPPPPEGIPAGSGSSAPSARLDPRLLSLTTPQPSSRSPGAALQPMEEENGAPPPPAEGIPASSGSSAPSARLDPQPLSRTTPQPSLRSPGVALQPEPQQRDGAIASPRQLPSPKPALPSSSASASSAAPVAPALPPDPNYKDMSVQEKTAARNIMITLGKKRPGRFASLAFSSWYLEQQGKHLECLHPLQVLFFIYVDPEDEKGFSLKEGLQTIRTDINTIWPRYVERLNQTLTKVRASPYLDWYIWEFSNSLSLNPNVVKGYIQADACNGQGLVDYMLRSAKINSDLNA